MTDFNKFRQTLEEKKGLWDNIHAKRKRGEKMRKPGEEGAPTDQDFKNAQKKESVAEGDKYDPGHIGAIQKMLAKEREDKKKRDAAKKESVEEKKTANEAKDGDGANIVRDREFKGKKLSSQPRAKPGDKGFNSYDKLFKKGGQKPAWMDREKMKKESVVEKKLTAAELKKREEIAKAMERDNPGMDMSKKMAIATATAKRVAEQSLYEKVYASDYNVGAEKSKFGGYTPVVTHKKTGRTMYSAQHSYKKPEHAKGHASAYLNGYQAMGDRHADRKAREYATQNQKHQHVNESVDLDEAVQVKKQDYKWGRMVTVHHGNSHSFPLHPEHQEKIKKLKHGEKTNFKDETGKNITAHRDDDKIKLKHPNANKTTTVDRSHFTESLDISEISLDMLTKKISNSGMNTTKKANKMDKTKNDLAALRAKLAGKPAMAKEAYEDDEPASPDEASMAMRQLGFIEYAAEEVMDHIKSGKEFPEWMQNKLSKLHGQMESLHSALGEHGEDDEEMKEAVSNNMRLISKIKNSGVVKTGSMAKDTKPAPKKEGINTADKKSEKFVKPDGKVGIRMVSVDKKIVDKDA